MGVSEEDEVKARAEMILSVLMDASPANSMAALATVAGSIAIYYKVSRDDYVEAMGKCYDNVVEAEANKEEV